MGKKNMKIKLLTINCHENTKVNADFQLTSDMTLLPSFWVKVSTNHPQNYLK